LPEIFCKLLRLARPRDGNDAPGGSTGDAPLLL
jgi:hypothetical protein